MNTTYSFRWRGKIYLVEGDICIVGHVIRIPRSRTLVFVSSSTFTEGEYEINSISEVQVHKATLVQKKRKKRKKNKKK